MSQFSIHTDEDNDEEEYETLVFFAQMSQRNVGMINESLYNNNNDARTFVRYNNVCYK